MTEWKELQKGWLRGRYDFGTLKDNKDRFVGCVLHVRENYEIWADGTKIRGVVGWIQSTRNGVEYGAFNVKGQTLYNNVEEAKRELEKKAAKSEKRARREAINGVYYTERARSTLTKFNTQQGV